MAGKPFFDAADALPIISLNFDTPIRRNSASIRARAPASEKRVAPVRGRSKIGNPPRESPANDAIDMSKAPA